MTAGNNYYKILGVVDKVVDGDALKTAIRVISVNPRLKLAKLCFICSNQA